MLLGEAFAMKMFSLTNNAVTHLCAESFLFLDYFLGGCISNSKIPEKKGKTLNCKIKIYFLQLFVS